MTQGDPTDRPNQPLDQEVASPKSVTPDINDRTATGRSVVGANTAAIGRRRIEWPLVALVAPSMILLGLFYFLPNILNFGYALTDWTSFKSNINFIGLDNFSDLARDGVLADVILT